MKDRIIQHQKEFQRAVRDIIEEQDSYTLRLAYRRLCNSANINLQSILGMNNADTSKK